MDTNILLTLTLPQILLQVEVSSLLGDVPHLDIVLEGVVHVGSMIEKKLDAAETASANSQDERSLRTERKKQQLE